MPFISEKMVHQQNSTELEMEKKKKIDKLKKKLRRIQFQQKIEELRKRLSNPDEKTVNMDYGAKERELIKRRYSQRLQKERKKRKRRLRKQIREDPAQMEW